MNSIKWLIWSHKHQAWWKPYGRGYTNNQTMTENQPNAHCAMALTLE